IKSSFGGKGDTAAQAQAAKATGAQFVDINVERVYAHRGEVVVGVNGTVTTAGGKVTRADLRGAFLNGQQVSLQLAQANGGRELRISGNDGGGALRAANLYSKIAGGEITFYALIANDASSSIRRGILTMKNFEVRNEAALAELDQKGKPRKSGPRKGGITFKRLNLPFTTDAKFIRLGDTLIRGSELGATAEGIIRKTDGAMDITGTIIPAYGLNSALSDIPLVGEILTGGKGQGIFGLTYALGGTINKPKFEVNPVSAIAPGIFRKLFEYSGPGSAPKPKAGDGKDG
ncbi:MAG: AsmA-like C-terminal domain-containing protein, partial [Aestuariivirga sp.]